MCMSTSTITLGSIYFGVFESFTMCCLDRNIENHMGLSNWILLLEICLNHHQCSHHQQSSSKASWDNTKPWLTSFDSLG